MTRFDCMVSGRSRTRMKRGLCIILLALWPPLHPVHAQVGEETGGIGGTGISNETGGIGGTGVNRIVGYGKIQAFGSVFVNGREYAITSGTLVSIDGAPATAANLKLGDLALVYGVAGRGTEGTALSISIEHAITGRITALTGGGRGLEVLGQDVAVGPSTIIAGTGHPLAVGRMVTISAQQQPDGVWMASRIEPAPEGAALRLEATIDSIDPRTGRIRLGNLQARAAGAFLASARPGERVFALMTRVRAGLKVTALAPATPNLGAPGTMVEAEDFFTRAGEHDLVSPDGLVATAPSMVKVPSEATEPSLVVGAVNATGTIEVSRIELPPMPERGVLRQPNGNLREPQGESAQPESNEASQSTGSPEASEPSVNEPEIVEPETTPSEINTPEITEPEIQTPEIPEPDLHVPDKD